jgi:hypothetical protein
MTEICTTDIHWEENRQHFALMRSLPHNQFPPDRLKQMLCRCEIEADVTSFGVEYQ